MIKLWKGGILTGTVLGEDGSPEVKCSVQALRESFPAGTAKWRRYIGRETDDRGVFRLVVPPGRYLVAASAPGGGARASGCKTRVFAPGVLEAAAALPIAVAGGEEFSLTVRLPVIETSTIQGSLVGTLAGVVRLVLLPAGPSNSSAPVPVMTTVLASRSSQFTFEGVPVGVYRLLAYSFPPTSARQFDGGWVRGLTPAGSAAGNGSEATFGESDVVVKADSLSRVSVVMKAGAHISGTVVSDVPAVPAQKAIPRFVTVERIDGLDLGLMPLTELNAVGAFTTAGLPPGDYLLTPSDGTTGVATVVKHFGKELESGVVTVTDTAVTSISITLSTVALAKIRGVIQRASGAPCAACSVYVFPESRSSWATYRDGRLFEGVTDDDGRFVLDQVPPGRYMAVAAPEFDPAWRKLTRLAELAEGAQSIQLSAAGQFNLDIRLKK